MSKNFASSFSPQTPSSSDIRPSKDETSTHEIVLTKNYAPISEPTSYAGPSAWQAPAHSSGSTPVDILSKLSLRSKNRTPEELEIIARTSANFLSRLALDHQAVLNPETDTPFYDTVDVVNRLLPYHVYQQPHEDLNLMLGRKGKRKATESDLKLEIEGGVLQKTKFALECTRRRRALEKRFRQVKLRSGKRPSPDDQTLVLTQAILEADRSDIALLNSELRAARSELDRIEREKRATTSTPRNTYYPPTTVSGVQPQYYRGYPYAYTQAYGAPNSGTTIFSASPTTTPTNYTPYQSSSAIPVQLPVASLPALHALGIVPVPAGSLPPTVLRGSTSDGTMLSLEINVSLLQSAQMSGLAMVLNTLMSRSNNRGYTASSTATPAVSNGTNDNSAN
ncbi:hypothetical protein BD779DRAFT_1609487 [Infundibulicybe gibba]|nr:hypothetical protein BD779DRAFT_1609487 [Infundibulicybe gibba]